MSAATSNAELSHEQKTSMKLLVLGALGVVYGDIGTSPLYAFKEVFAGNHPIPLTEAMSLVVCR
jgi:K+ transporter